MNTTPECCWLAVFHHRRAQFAHNPARAEFTLEEVNLPTSCGMEHDPLA